jgi:hypothetical protein
MSSGTRPFAGVFDRRGVEVETVEGGIGEGLGHQDGRRAVTATDVGDAGAG